MELIDVVDKDGQYLKTQERDEKINKSEYINTVHIYLLRNDNEIYIQQRSEKKEENPNFWEVVGGGVLSDEDIEVGALRELKEETGIEFKNDDLTLIGSLIYEKYLVNAFVVKINDKLEFRPQLSEVKNSMFVTFNEILNLIDKDRFYSSSFGLFQKYYKENQR